MRLRSAIWALQCSSARIEGDDTRLPKIPYASVVLCVSGGQFVVHVALKITAVVAVVADVQVYAQKCTANSLVAQLSSKLPSEWS